MRLKKDILLLLLLGLGNPMTYASGKAVMITDNSQTINQNIDEARLKELQEFRKKYKLAEPKASASELKGAQMALKMLH